MNKLLSRYRELLFGKRAGFTRRAYIILLLAFSLLGNTFARAHHVHQSASAALSHQLSGAPGKTGVPAKHHTIAC
jgi:hypothetical protein